MTSIQPWQTILYEAMAEAHGDHAKALEILARECVLRGKGVSPGYLRMRPAVAPRPPKTQRPTAET